MLALKVDHAHMVLDDHSVIKNDAVELADAINWLLLKYRNRCDAKKEFCYSFIRLNPLYKLLVVVDPEKEENPYLLLYGIKEKQVTRLIPYAFLKVLKNDTTFAALDYIIDNVDSCIYRRLQMDKLTQNIKENINTKKKDEQEEDRPDH